MKYIEIFLVFALNLTGVFGLIEKEVKVSEDAQKIQEVVKTVEKAVNEADAQTLLSLTSKTAKENFKEDLIKALYGRKLDFSIELDANSFKEITGDRITFTAYFNVKGLDYEKKRVKTFFTLEKKDNNWLIIDTDFYKKLRPINFWSLMMKYTFISGVLMVILYGFWLYMFLQLLKSNEKDKIVWIVIFVLLQFIGACAYWLYKRFMKHTIKHY